VRRNRVSAGATGALVTAMLKPRCRPRSNMPCLSADYTQQHCKRAHRKNPTCTKTLGRRRLFAPDPTWGACSAPSGSLPYLVDRRLTALPKNPTRLSPSGFERALPRKVDFVPTPLRMGLGREETETHVTAYLIPPGKGDWHRPLLSHAIINATCILHFRSGIEGYNLHASSRLLDYGDADASSHWRSDVVKQIRDCWPTIAQHLHSSSP